MPKGFFFLQELESPMTSMEKAFLINKFKKKTLQKFSCLAR